MIKENKKLVALLTVPLLILPTLTFATQFWETGVPSPDNIITAGGIPGIINAVFNFIWPIIAGIVVLFFILAAFDFITSRGEPGKLAQARQFLLWAVIGTVILMLAFSIPFIIKSAFNLN